MGCSYDWFVPIYEKHHDTLIRYARRVVDEELAKDLVQIVFLKMLRKYEELKDHPKIIAWLIVTLNNQIQSELQKLHYSNELPLDTAFNLSYEDPQADDFYALLPPDFTQEEKRLLYLHIEAGYSLKELAGVYGLTYDACRKRYYRLIIRCKEMMQKKISKKNLKTCPNRTSSSNIYNRRCQDG